MPGVGHAHGAEPEPPPRTRCTAHRRRRGRPQHGASLTFATIWRRQGRVRSAILTGVLRPIALPCGGARGAWPASCTTGDAMSLPTSRLYLAVRRPGAAVLVAAVLVAAAACSGDDVAVQGGPSDALGAGGTVGLDGGLADAAGATVPGKDAVGADASAADASAPRADGGGAPGGCRPDECAIGDACVANQTVNPANPCQRCLVLAGASNWTAANEAQPCDDGNACTQSDACAAGTCAGLGLPCADASPCTADSCDATSGSCVHLPSAATCDDASACTVGDACADGKCAAGKALACDDGNPCTLDTCGPVVGCEAAAHDAACDDGNACTKADACKAGTCGAGTPLDCDDADVCTVDSCNAKVGCQHKSVAPKCLDNNPCTDEGCDKKLGCVYPANAKPCDDGSLCTAADACKDTVCLGAVLPIDDANPCTYDTCDPKVGVSHGANAAPCDDGNACTVGDTCAAATCVKGANALPCDDQNPCTDDACDPVKACVSVPNASTCTDGNVCTVGDVCSAATCAGKKLDCDDGNKCTDDSCDAKAGCKHAVIVSNACRPQIIVDYPPRAATLTEVAGKVTVKGKVASGAGPIVTFQLNGKDVAVGAGGVFSTTLQAKPGGNTLVFVAKDDHQGEKKRVQSFLWSTTYFKPVLEVAKSGMVDVGLGFWLSQAVIDDGDHSLPANDLATIFELYLKTIDLNKLIGGTAFEFNALGKWKLTLSNLKNAPPTVTLKSQPGGMHMVATFSNVTADILLDPPTGQNLKGTMTLSSIAITTDVVSSVTPDHKIAVAMTNTDVKLNGLNVKFTGLAGALVGTIINLLQGVIKPSIEKAFEDQVVKALAPALGSALNALLLDTSFEVTKLDGSGAKIKVFLQTDASKVVFEAAGGAFLERARAAAKKAIAYDNLGVPGRIGCGNGVQALAMLKTSPLEIGIADDTFNELLFATWTGGLYEFPVPASMLGNVDLQQYGVSDLTMKVSAMLAPTLDDCNTKAELDAHIGDFRVDAKLKLLGAPMDVIIYVTFKAGVEIKVAAGAVGIALTKVKASDLEVNVAQDNLVASEKVLEKLVAENLLTGLVAQLGGSALGSFPLPAIDLSAALPSLPKGTAIAIAPKQVTRKDGNSIVGGTLK
ncbi:MAG: hypothetical protein EXR79_10370 [Myxococcales bacterium]|nr:hypothetical protein [Myxococcales bacterium]